MIQELVAAGVDLDHTNKLGETALHDAATFADTDIIRILLSFGASPHIRDINEDTFIHRLCDWEESEQLQDLRQMEVCGIDPDQCGPIFSVTLVERFEERILFPTEPVQDKPTQATVFEFYAMVHELRQRNWDAGLFLDSKAKLESEGGIKHLRLWLGWQWQNLHDFEGFGEEIWDPDIHRFPDECDYQDELKDAMDYDTSLLFGISDQGIDSAPEFEQQHTNDQAKQEEDGDEDDEFFDALP
jgi:hypothetical protein